MLHFLFQYTAGFLFHSFMHSSFEKEKENSATELKLEARSSNLKLINNYISFKTNMYLKLLNESNLMKALIN